MYSIWQFAVARLADNTILKGVVVHGDGKLGSKKQYFLRILKAYRIKPARGLSLTVKHGNDTYQTQTDDHGGFALELDIPYDAELSIFAEGMDEQLKVVPDYPTRFNLNDHPKYVVSDIDDTILYSYSPRTFKRIRTALFIGPNKRKPIRPTHRLLRSYQQKGAAIVYLSKSESNLFPNIVHFIRENDIPQGYLLLTPFLTALQLFNPQKKKDYKNDRLEYLLAHTTAPFILIGDDGQRDMEIYTQICKEYGHRVEKVYIYRTRDRVSDRKQKNWEALVDTGVPAVYYGEDDFPE